MFFLISSSTYAIVKKKMTRFGLWGITFAINSIFLCTSFVIIIAENMEEIKIRVSPYTIPITLFSFIIFLVLAFVGGKLEEKVK